MVRDAVPLGECKRALVIKLRHHGDVLLASPVIGALRAHAPSLEVDALVYDDTAPMLEGHPGLAQLHTVGRKWRGLNFFEKFRVEKRLFEKLRERRFDLIVHLSEQPRGAWLARRLGARWSVAPAMPDRGALWRDSFTHFYRIAPRRHMVEVNLDALRRIGVQPSPGDRKVVFVPGSEAERRARELVGEGPYVHLHPASRWRFKCWPAEKNAELIDRLSEKYRVVVTAAPDPEELNFVKAIAEKAKAPFLDLAGKLSIKELGAVAARAKLFVGVDSMPMHLAAAMGAPTVALFGPSGEAEWGPWDVAHRVVASPFTCRPCGLDGCGGGKVSDCLVRLPVDTVHRAARELLPQ